MKRQPVSKTFVRQECQTLGKQLRCRYEKALSREIGSLARMTQRSLTDLESRLVRLEAKMKRKR